MDNYEINILRRGGNWKKVKPDDLIIDEINNDIDEINNELNHDNELNYSSAQAIAGFQFDHDGCITGASGGESEAAGFTVSVSPTTVLGFSFAGSILPTGENLILTI